MKLTNTFIMLLATAGQVVQLVHAEPKDTTNFRKNNRNLSITKERCTSVETKYEMLVHEKWIERPLAEGTKCCPSSIEGKIVPTHNNVACPIIENTSIVGVRGASTGASTMPLASAGDQRCVYPIETAYEEFEHGEWKKRETPGGTKCCPHLSGKKKIILEHVTMDCQSNFPSSSPTTSPSSPPTPIEEALTQAFLKRGTRAAATCGLANADGCKNGKKECSKYEIKPNGAFGAGPLERAIEVFTSDAKLHHLRIHVMMGGMTPSWSKIMDNALLPSRVPSLVILTTFCKI